MTEKKLERLVIQPSDNLPYSPGDFGEVVNEESKILYLPSGTYAALEQTLGGKSNIKDTVKLAGYLVNFPSTFKRVQYTLGWTDDEFSKAWGKLINSLGEYMPTIELPQIKINEGAAPGHERELGKTPKEIEELREGRKKN
ncbi:MAG: hypothetical protein Q8R47_05670 [Nanoarchaeota archaeon]|nr:hypothetical protein [Nanoarchaeota archaeon]